MQINLGILETQYTCLRFLHFLDFGRHRYLIIFLGTTCLLTINKGHAPHVLRNRVYSSEIEQSFFKKFQFNGIDRWLIELRQKICSLE